MRLSATNLNLCNFREHSTGIFDVIPSPSSQLPTQPAGALQRLASREVLRFSPRRSLRTTRVNPRAPSCPRSPRSPRSPRASEGQPMTHRREVRCGPIGLSRLGPSPTGAVGRRPWISEVAGFCRCSNSPNEFRDPRKRGEQRRSNGFAIGGHLACRWAGDSSVGRPIIHSSKRATGASLAWIDHR